MRARARSRRARPPRTRISETTPGLCSWRQHGRGVRGAPPPAAAILALSHRPRLSGLGSARCCGPGPRLWGTGPRVLRGVLPSPGVGGGGGSGFQVESQGSPVHVRVGARSSDCRRGPGIAQQDPRVPPQRLTRPSAVTSACPPRPPPPLVPPPTLRPCSSAHLLGAHVSGISTVMNDTESLPPLRTGSGLSFCPLEGFPSFAKGMLSHSGVWLTGVLSVCRLAFSFVHVS